MSTVNLNYDKRLLYWAAGLSIGEIVGHIIDLPDHLTEWWVYSTFFLMAATIQMFYGAALFLRPWRFDENGSLRKNTDSIEHPIFLFGLFLNLLIFAVYFVTRVTGIPFLGPNAAAEPVTFLSLVPMVPEIPLIICLFVLVRRTSKHKDANSEQS